MDDLPDPELMRRLAAGEDAALTALTALMDRWSARLLAFLSRMTGSADTAKDLAQEAFVRLYQSRAAYRPGSSFSAYLFAIAANLGRNHLRWRSRHPERSGIHDLSGEKTLATSADPSPDPREHAESAENTAAIEAAFQALPAELREPFHLHIYEDLSHTEIAKICGCSVKAVETRIYRARRFMRELLGHRK